MADYASPPSPQAILGLIVVFAACFILPGAVLTEMYGPLSVSKIVVIIVGGSIVAAYTIRKFGTQKEDNRDV